MPYIFRNQAERKKAMKFWRVHPALTPRDPDVVNELLKHKRTAKPVRRLMNRYEERSSAVVLVPLHPSNDTTTARPFEKWAVENWDLIYRQPKPIGLDRPVEDPAIFYLEHEERMKELIATFDALTDEELEQFAEGPTN